jgi:phosphoesterase RecJ-like protein
MTEQIRQNIIDALLQSKHVLITAHRSPDGDSLGSQIGLAGLLKSQGIPHVIVNEGVIPDKYRFLPGIESVCDIRDFKTSGPKFDTAAVIECSTLERIGEVGRLVDEQCRIINIDHHQDNTCFGNINLKETQASAAGEMIYNILRHGSFPIDKEMATSLYTAILTDTGRFHYSSTTPECMKVAGDLLALGADTVEITENVYYNLRPQVMRLTGMVIAGMQYHLEGRLCLLTVDNRMMEEAQADRGDTEGLINYSMYASGVEVGVLFTEIDDKITKVSFRSQKDFDVADIAAQFGGGGHTNASGCVVELPLDKTRETILKVVRDRINGSV